MPKQTQNKLMEKPPTTHVKDTLNVAIVSTPIFRVFPPSYGGTELITGLLSQELAKAGHNVTLFAPNGSFVKNCTIIETGEPQTPSITSWLNSEKTLIEQIKPQLGEFDVIHDHNFFGLIYTAKFDNQKLKIIHTHHTAILANYAKNKPSKLNTVAISDFMKERYEKAGVKSKRVHNGIDISQYKLQKMKSDRYLWFSRIAFFKAPHKAIEIAKKTGIKIDIAGCTSFEEDQKYIQQIKKECDGKQIRFIGEVSQKEKVELLQNARALIVTSNWGEPFGLHIIEALACGTGVLALADGGIKETIHGGGILCRDEYELANAIKRYQPINPKKCRDNAELFTAKKMAVAYEKLYKKILFENDEW